MNFLRHHNFDIHNDIIWNLSRCPSLLLTTRLSFSSPLSPHINRSKESTPITGSIDEVTGEIQEAISRAYDYMSDPSLVKTRITDDNDLLLSADLIGRTLRMLEACSNNRTKKEPLAPSSSSASSSSASTDTTTAASGSGPGNNTTKNSTGPGTKGPQRKREYGPTYPLPRMPNKQDLLLMFVALTRAHRHAGEGT